MLRNITAVLLLACTAGSALPQYDQTVAVEGNYLPEIIPQERIGMYPKPERFKATASPLEYSMRGVAANFTPQAIPMQATGWRDTRVISNCRGYLEGGLGSWLTSTLSAGYRIIDSEKASFGVMLQHNSTSFWKANLDGAIKETTKYRYDENLGIYGGYDFGGNGKLDASATYHLGYFNYYGYSPLDYYIPADLKVPTQTLNDVAAHVGWHTSPKLENLSANASIGVRYFGYRSLYMADEDGLTALSGGRETHAWLRAGLSYATSTKSSIGIDLEGNLIVYSDYKHSTYPEFDIDAPGTYGLIRFTPYYRFARELLNVKIGALVDISFNAGVAGNHYKTFHIAPQVTADYNAGPARIYLHLLGGSELHTLSSGYDMDYYQQPGIFNTRPVYTPLDAKAGVAVGPFSGFEVGADVAYRISRGQYFGGWYQTGLNTLTCAVGSLPRSIDGSNVIYDYTSEGTGDLKGFSVGAYAQWDGGRYFKVKAEGTYQPQHAETGYFNGYDRSRWTAGISAESNPWSTLKIKVAYTYRGVRVLPVWGVAEDASGELNRSIQLCRLSDLTTLNAGIAYQINRHVGIWVQGDNLLNRHDARFPGLAAEGLTITGGISWVF